MKRLTISVPDGLAEYAQSQVAAGSAPSMSAWVADAMRRKAQARLDLIDEIEAMERENPTTPETIDWLAKQLGIPRDQAAKLAATPLPRPDVS